MKLVKGLLVGAGTLAAALVFTAGPASAHYGDDDGGNVGILNGNQLDIPVHVPVNVCGNSLAILALIDSGHGTVCVND